MPALSHTVCVDFLFQVFLHLRSALTVISKGIKCFAATAAGVVLAVPLVFLGSKLAEHLVLSWPKLTSGKRLSSQYAHCARHEAAGAFTRHGMILLLPFPLLHKQIFYLENRNRGKLAPTEGSNN